jgi:hypothetical protein
VSILLAVLDAKGERWSQLPGYPKAKEPAPLPYCIRHSRNTVHAIPVGWPAGG